MFTPVHRLEADSLVAHMEASRPNRPELCCMLYMTFPNEINNAVEIQFMGKGCYHSEFYKWTHNVVADDLLQNKEAHMIFIVVFLGLKKEWHQVLSQIGSLLGT